MNINEIITIFISLMALIVSITTSVFVYRQTYKVNRYEFISAEETKKDILKLFSALHLIVEKNTYKHLIVNIDFYKEQEIIADFLLSDTWCITRYILKNDDNFIMINAMFFIIIYDKGGSIGETAKQLGEKISEIYNQHFDEVLNEKEKLKKKISRFSEENQFNIKWYEKRDNSRTELDIRIQQKIKDLIDSGVEDPNLKLWLGTLTNDVKIVEKGLKDGADVNSSIEDIIKKYNL